MSWLNKITTAIRGVFGQADKDEPLQTDEAQVMGMGRLVLPSPLANELR